MAEERFFRERARCELCDGGRRRVLLSRSYGSPELAEFLDRYYQGRVPLATLAAGRYEIDQCEDCGFLWQGQVLEERCLDRLYGEWINPEGSLAVKERSELALFAGYARQIELVARLGGKPPGETRVLDFGMGWGHWCRMAAAYGFPVWGFETSPRRRAFAERAGTPVLGDLAELGSGRFDFINAEQVFEHIPDPLASLRPLAASLAAGGTIRISVPDSRGAARRLARPDWRPRKDALQPLEHVNGFTNRTLRRFAAAAGLRPLRQPFLPGQGLLGKSYRRGPGPWLKSVAGVPYRRLLGTTLWFGKET